MISTPFIEVHMNLDKLKEKLIPILERQGLSLYSIRTKREFGEKIVEILIDVEVMDINELEKIHVEYQLLLTDDDLDPTYYLELSSLGAERPLKSRDEMIKAITRYIYLESSTYKGYGTLLSVEDDKLLLEVNDKGRIKKIEIAYESVRKARTAIKF